MQNTNTPSTRMLYMTYLQVFIQPLGHLRSTMPIEHTCIRRQHCIGCILYHSSVVHARQKIYTRVLERWIHNRISLVSESHLRTGCFEFRIRICNYTHLPSHPWALENTPCRILGILNLLQPVSKHPLTELRAGAVDELWRRIVYC